jgi:hypothetical protein
VNLNKCAKFHLNLSRCLPGAGQAGVDLPWYSKLLTCPNRLQLIRIRNTSNLCGLVLRIRDVYPGSRIRIKEYRYFNPKKWFLSSWKYDQGCSSRIRILILLPIPDAGVKKAPDPEHCLLTCRWGPTRRRCT